MWAIAVDVDWTVNGKLETSNSRKNVDKNPEVIRIADFGFL